MKKFKWIGLIVIALVFIGGCGNQKESAKDASSISSTKKHTSNKSKTNKTSSSKKTSESSNLENSTSTSEDTAMNFDEISSGNYNSLLGNWKIVASSGNHFDGRGITWDTPTGNEHLDVTNTQISNGDITLQGTSITTNGEAGIGTIKNENGFLDIDGEVGAMNCSFSFYPKGIPSDGWGDDTPTSIDINKDRIFVRTSNNGHVEVFER